MERRIGTCLWHIAVALYLIANGILGITKSGGDFIIIYRAVFGRGDFTTFLAMFTSVIALIAGGGVILELFNVEIPCLDVLLLIVGIVWAVYIVVEIISWVNGKSQFGFKKDVWYVLQMLAVHLMVLGSLLTAGKRFDR